MPLIGRCIALCRENPARVVLPDGEDARAVSAAMRLVREGLAEPVLLGRPLAVREHVRAVLRKEGGPSVPVRTLDPTSPAFLERNAAEYQQLTRERGKEVSLEEAARTMRCPLATAAMLVRRGEAEVGVGGNISSTSDTIRAGLRIIGLAPGCRTVSGFFFMISPGATPEERSVYIFADAGVIPEPTVEQHADIAIGSAEQYRRMTGKEPRVAMLSFSSRGSAKHPRADHMRKATELVRGKAPDLVVEVLSPSNAALDRSRKSKVYARFGVPESQVVLPRL